jgi:hypothetical protein
LKKRWTSEGVSSYITKEHAKKYCHGKRGKEIKARGFEPVIRKLIKLE